MCVCVCVCVCVCAYTTSQKYFAALKLISHPSVSLNKKKCYAPQCFYLFL